MRTLLVLLTVSLATPVWADDWVHYFSNRMIIADYDKETKTDHTISVRWSYRKKPGAETELTVYYRFKAYCSTRQLFSVTREGLEQEVPVAEDSLYEATWKVICGIH